MSFEFSEDVNSRLPGWVPVKIRFELLGTIEFDNQPLRLRLLIEHLLEVASKEY
jgi:hypothetical protein